MSITPEQELVIERFFYDFEKYRKNVVEQTKAVEEQTKAIEWLTWGVFFLGTAIALAALKYFGLPL